MTPGHPHLIALSSLHFLHHFRGIYHIPPGQYASVHTHMRSIMRNRKRTWQQGPNLFEHLSQYLVQCL